LVICDIGSSAKTKYQWISGTVNFSYQNEPVMPPSQSVTGDMNGAFFGPRAEQVGGVFAVHRTGESSLLQDAFVGKQRGP